MALDSSGAQVRLKGCGKSAPREPRGKRHGKPHLEQDRIGGAHGRSLARAPGVSHEVSCKRHPRGMVAEPRVKARGTEPGL